MWGGLKAHIEENPFDHIVPMMGDRRIPYSVFFRSQYPSSWKDGYQIGGIVTITSLSGRVALQNTFLQSPFWSNCLSSTALSVRRRRELFFKTGA